MTRIKINNNSAEIVGEEFYTSGMVGAKIAFQFSEEWNGLTKTAVFRTDHLQKDVLNVTNVCTIPHECLEKAGERLVVGVYGTNGNDIVIPTIYVSLGRIKQGADPSGDVSADPTLPVWAQVQEAIGNLSQIETETKDSLVAAINEVKQTADRKANAADLAPVATSGSYSDLTDKPTIPSVPTATIEANATARHTHDNKTLLDSITEAVKTAWNTASEWVITNGSNVLSHLSDGVKHITAAERTKWNDKQDTISDLEAIRTGAAKGATALQSVPSTYRTASEQDTIDSGKVDKVTGKGLSTNDYTAAAKAKVDTIPANPKYTDTVYDDTALKERVATIEGKESAWDAKSNFSGSYNDLTDKPTPLIGTTNELTPTQVREAVSVGIPVKVQYTHSTYGIISFTAFTISESLNMLASNIIIYYNGVYILVELIGYVQSGGWGFISTTLAQKTDIPSALPNPNALTIKIGSNTITYDGSTAQTVTIADGTEVSY